MIARIDTVITHLITPADTPEHTYGMLYFNYITYITAVACLPSAKEVWDGQKIKIYHSET
jgi:hypothetical protein